MKRIGVFLTEEVLYLAALAYLYTSYSDRFMATSVAAIFIIPAAGIGAVNLVHNILNTKLKSILTENNEGYGIWTYRFTVFLCVFLINYVSFSALEYFGNMSASFRTLVILSLIASVSHLMFNFFVETLTMTNDNLVKGCQCEYDYDLGEGIDYYN